MSFSFRPMDELSARVIARWRYDAPYAVYNIPSDALEETVRCFLDPQNGYHTLHDEQGQIVAYCCYGPDARVVGGDYGRQALDLGLGVRPDLTDQGRGLDFVQAAIEFARRTFEPLVCRVTVAEFNKRALRVWEKAGFRPVQAFERDGDGMPFVILACTLNKPVR